MRYNNDDDAVPRLGLLLGLSCFAIFTLSIAFASRSDVWQKRIESTCAKIAELEHKDLEVRKMAENIDVCLDRLVRNRK